MFIKEIFHNGNIIIRQELIEKNSTDNYLTCIDKSSGSYIFGFFGVNPWFLWKLKKTSWINDNIKFDDLIQLYEDCNVDFSLIKN